MALLVADFFFKKFFVTELSVKSSGVMELEIVP
jgi:hypothetical protein